MTFDEWLDEFYLSSERPDDPNYYFIVALRKAWNAAVEQVLKDIQSLVQIDEYQNTNIDFDNATKACTRLLTK